MKGVATRYIVMFVLGMISLMVAVDMFFSFTGFFNRLDCRFHSLRNLVFKSDDPVAAEKCVEKRSDMETHYISGNCGNISEQLASYMIACWERSYGGRAGRDIWCYELYVDADEDCPATAVAGEITRIFRSLGLDSLNDRSSINVDIPRGQGLVYVTYNSTAEPDPGVEVI